MNHNGEFDLLVDGALAEYCEAEPLAGMEERILHRLQGAQADRRNLSWRWSAAIACAALIVSVSWLGLHESSTKSTPASPAVVQQPTPANRIAAENNTVGRSHTAGQPHSPAVRVGPPQSAALRQLEPRSKPSVYVSSEQIKDQFPTPRPLNAQERNLVLLAQAHPEALLEARDKHDELVIPTIKIKHTEDPSMVEIKLLPEPYSDSAGDN